MPEKPCERKPRMRQECEKGASQQLSRRWRREEKVPKFQVLIIKDMQMGTWKFLCNLEFSFSSAERAVERRNSPLAGAGRGDTKLLLDQILATTWDAPGITHVEFFHLQSHLSMVSCDPMVLTRPFFESLQGPDGKRKVEKAVQPPPRLPPWPRLEWSRRRTAPWSKGLGSSQAESQLSLHKAEPTQSRLITANHG
jgi:hypothetical protein